MQYQSDSFNDFKKMLDQGYLAQLLCIIAQLFLTIITSLKVYQNRQEFPIKQLGPFTTVIAIINFQLVNIINVIGKVIQTSNGYFDMNKKAQSIQLCGQCRLNSHVQMIILAITYCFLREMQFIIFSLKLFRVSLCYWKPFYKKKQVSQWVIKLFSSDINMLIIVLIHTIIVTSINYIVFINSLTEIKSTLLFTFLCPKKSSYFQYIILGERFILFLTTYIMSINTYKKIDFKKFLLAFYLISNAEILLRAYTNSVQISQQTYRQFYYHSFISALFGSIIMAYFSQFKQIVNASPGKSIIDSWITFRNVATGVQILKCFSKYLDMQLHTEYFQKAFGGFLYFDEHMKIAIDIGKNIKYEQQRNQINEILSIGHQLKIPKEAIQQISNNNNAGAISVKQLRSLQNYLSKFCQNEIYKKWKLTYSYRYYIQECQNNSLINEKLELFNIQFG